MSKTINRKLDMTPGGVMLVIHMSQYDSDFTIVFSLYNSDGVFAIESGTTARIRGTKKSGTGYSVSAMVDVSAKTVTVVGDQQMTAVAGINIYEIVLYRNDLEICSANFILAVERAALDKDTITDKTVVPELERLDEYIEQAAEYGAREGAAYAESWAVGGTGKRPGEDTDNAKYWAEQAAGAIAGVSSFNGRTGAVVPESGDYTTQNVTRNGDTLEDSLATIESNVGSAIGGLTTLSGRMTTAEGTITSQGTRLATAESDIDALETRATGAESDISSQGTRLTTAEGDIDSLDGRVSTAESTITSHGTRLTTAEGNITSQGTRLTTAEGDIDTINDTTIPALQSAINGKVSMDDALFNLDTTQAATTEDGALYEAITAIGWGGVVSNQLLKLKELLTKVSKRINFRITDVTVNNQTIAANSAQWVTVPLPTSGKAIGVSGWYFSATDLNLFSLQLNNAGCSMAFRNPTSSALTTSARVFFIVVD